MFSLGTVNPEHPVGTVLHVASSMQTAVPFPKDLIRLVAILLLFPQPHLLLLPTHIFYFTGRVIKPLPQIKHRLVSL